MAKDLTPYGVTSLMFILHKKSDKVFVISNYELNNFINLKKKQI